MRIDQITFTRFLAAISIVVFHFGLDVFPFNSVYLKDVFSQANVGVSYFFILSGFVMVIAYQNHDKIEYINYYKNRFARIYPIYLIGLLAFVFFQILNNSSISITELTLNVFLLQAWYSGRTLSLNFPGWSISVELFFYILFPLIMNFYLKIKRKEIFNYVVIVFWLFSQILLYLLFNSSFYKGYSSVSHDMIFYHPFMHLNEFLIGIISAFYFLKCDKKNIKRFDVTILALVGLIVLFLKINNIIILQNGFMAIFFVPIIILSSLNSDGIITKIFKNKYLILLGEISFGIYILQVPIFRITYQFLDYFSVSEIWIRFYTAIFLLILISYYSYIFIEVPLRDRIKKYIFKKAL